VLISIALVLYIYRLIKAWCKKKFSRDTIQMIPMEKEEEGVKKHSKKGYDSDRKTLNTLEGGDPTRPTTVGDIERNKWASAVGGPSDPKQTEEILGDDEMSEFDPRRKKTMMIKGNGKKVPPPIKKQFNKSEAVTTAND